jgi:hypothetical protein
VEYGVYSFGRAKSYLPEAVGQDYLMSTGTGIVQFGTGPSPDVPITKLTYIGAFGTNLLVGWLDLVGGVSTFGIDKLNDACGFATAANWNSLWFDNGDPDVLKTPLAVKITCERCRPIARLPRLSCTTVITPNLPAPKAGQPIQAIAGDTDIVLPLDSADGFYEAAFGWNVVGSGVDDVRVRSLTFKFDDNRQNTNATEERHGT